MVPKKLGILEGGGGDYLSIVFAMDGWEDEVMSGKLLKGLKSKADGSVKAPAKDTPVAAPAKEDAPSAKRKEAPKDEFPWESVGATDTGVRSALKEVSIVVARSRRVVRPAHSECLLCIRRAVHFRADFDAV